MKKLYSEKYLKRSTRENSAKVVEFIPPVNKSLKNRMSYGIFSMKKLYSEKYLKGSTREN